MMPRRATAPALLLLAGVTLAACQRAATPPAVPARPVQVAPVAVETLGDGVHAVGVLTPKDEARLAFKVGGIIESIRVEEGARVRAGELLAVIKRAEVDAALTQARESAAKAGRDLARAEALYADGVATREALEDAGTAAALSRAALSSAEFNASHARIVAPADGVVLRKLAEAGEMVAAGQPVLVVGGAGRGWVVRVALADRDVVRVHLGDAVGVTFDAWPERAFSGRVSNIAAAADPATGTFTVEVAVAADGAAFVQGLIAKVTLTPARGAATTVVPVQSLVEADGERASLFVWDPATSVVHRVMVRVGRLVGTEVEVEGGLAPGTLIVTDGAAFLENGERVRRAAPAPGARARS